MKFQIDTQEKSIKVEGNAINLHQLTKFLKKNFPKGDWKKYSIESGVITNWIAPYYYDWQIQLWPTTNPFYVDTGTDVINVGCITGDETINGDGINTTTGTAYIDQLPEGTVISPS